MKLIRFGSPGHEKPGILLHNGRRIDASGFGSDYDEKFFESDGLTRLQAWAAIHAATAPDVDPSTRLGPCICRPSKIICIGLNYADHAKESGAEIPKEPILFFKSTTSLTGPNDPLIIPRGSEKTDWEVNSPSSSARRRFTSARRMRSITWPDTRCTTTTANAPGSWNVVASG